MREGCVMVASMLNYSFCSRPIHSPGRYHEAPCTVEGENGPNAAYSTFTLYHALKVRATYTCHKAKMNFADKLTWPTIDDPRMSW